MPPIRQRPRNFKLSQKIVSGDRKYWFHSAFTTKIAADEQAKKLRKQNVHGNVRTPSGKIQKKNFAIVKLRESNKPYPWVVYVSG